MSVVTAAGGVDEVRVAGTGGPDGGRLGHDQEPTRVLAAGSQRPVLVPRHRQRDHQRPGALLV